MRIAVSATSLRRTIASRSREDGAEGSGGGTAGGIQLIGSEISAAADIPEARGRIPLSS